MFRFIAQVLVINDGHEVEIVRLLFARRVCQSTHRFAALLSTIHLNLHRCRLRHNLARVGIRFTAC